MKASNPKAARSAARERLAEELAELIPSLDEEGLAFLVGQARVHLRNMEIDRLNAETEASLRAEAERVKAERESSKGARGDPQRGKKKGAKVAAGAKASEADPRADFRIERSSTGSSYHVISGGKWKMFTDGEMLAMVNIASSDDGMRDVAGRLWAWLDAERPDAFADLDIGVASDPKMAELVALLRAKFKVRKR